MEKELQAVIEVLRNGGLILYPTDTVWGIGCDATNEQAVEKIYKLKRSQDKHSMLVLCRDADMVVRYVNKAPGIAFEVMEMSENPLTLILEGAVGVAANLIPETGTLGVRVPNHEFCHQLLRKFGRPIVSTSANISGEPTPLKGLRMSATRLSMVLIMWLIPVSRVSLRVSPAQLLPLASVARWR